MPAGRLFRNYLDWTTHHHARSTYGKALGRPMEIMISVIDVRT